MNKILEGISLFFAGIIDVLLKRTKIMATIEEVRADVAEIATNLTALDLKLDEVRDYIAALKAQQGPVTQAQLDELAALVVSAKTSSSSALSEADALDDVV